MKTKTLFFSLILLLGLTSAFAQKNYWPKGAMEVKVYYQNPAEVQYLQSLNYDCELYNLGYGLFYIDAKQLAVIQKTGLKYEIIKNDLNAFSQNFWLKEDAYHSYDQIIALMDSLVTAFPNLCAKYNYGISYEGRQLAALKISDNVAADENEPEVMFDGGIHGDEIGCAENVIRFARQLCVQYNVVPRITNIVNNTEVWLYVMVNPDGRVNMVRSNANGVDLNRNWGYMWDDECGTGAPNSQLESKALRQCVLENQFLVHTTYHSGTEYISHPWSYRSNTCPDHNYINHLAYIYADSSTYTNIPYGAGNTGMYPINGSSKDFNYGVMGSVSWSMEISVNKQPPANEIMLYYNKNLPAMLSMCEYAQFGLHGTVTDSSTGSPVAAVIFVGSNFPTYTDPLIGDYHKYLTAGTYTVKVVANGYQPKTISNVVIQNNNITNLNVALAPVDTNTYVYRVIASQIPDNNTSDEGYTPASLGAPDNISYSIGKSGWVILDMQQSILDGPGDDFTIYEGDASPEGYTCYVSNSIDGPWASLGTATGTALFDLIDGSIAEARYIKIVDDGDGTATVADAGFDLDAISVLKHTSGVYLTLYEFSFNDALGNNNGVVEPGELITCKFILRNNGDISCDSTSGLLVLGNANAICPNNKADFGSLQYADTVSRTFYVQVSNQVTNGENIPLMLFVKSNVTAYTNSFTFAIPIGIEVEDFESNTFTQYSWVNTSASPWSITNSAPYEGTYCAKSGAIGNSSSTALEINMNVTSDNNISFYYKVSSENTWDWLKFYIDGEEKGKWSGEKPWTQASYPVTAGNHTFKWEYMKDGSSVGGQDAAWIDFIVFPPHNQAAVVFNAVADALPSVLCEAGTTQLVAFASGGDGNYTYSWMPTSGLSNPTIFNPIATVTSATSYQVIVTNNTAVDTAAVGLTVFSQVSPLVSQSNDTLYSNYTSGNQWYDGNGVIAGANLAYYVPQQVGDYYVMVTNEEGCVSDTSNILHFTGCFEQQWAESFIIYPNPNNGQFSIEGLDLSNPAILEIFNNKLQCIQKKCLSSGGDCQMIKMNPIQPGIYFLRITQQHHTIIQKLIIQ